MRPLRPLALALLLLAGSALPAAAQSTEELRLPEKLDRALRGMMKELGPALDEALDYMRSFEAVDDPRYYQLPEVLPNGDIIIRRRPDAPEYRPDGPAEPDAPRKAVPPIAPDEGIRT